MQIKSFFILIYLCCAIFLIPQNACSQEAKWDLQVCFPKALHIDCYYIDGKKYLPSESCPATLKINQLQKDSCLNVNIAELSGIQLRIHSNSGEPIQITADFEYLSNNSYSFSKDDLSITPEEMTICDVSKITSQFTPYVKIHSDVEPGTYSGTLMFTISEL